MSLISKDNNTISRVFSAEVEGKEVPVISLTGQVTPGKAMNMSVVFSDMQIALDNREDVVSAVNTFLDDLRHIAQSNGLPL